MPWGDNNRQQGPWGTGGGNQPTPPSGGGKNNPQPDFDEIIRKAKAQLDQMFKGNNGGMLIILVLLGVVLWLATGVYTVQPGEEGVVLRFGKYHRASQPGINYHLPQPIERVLTVSKEKINTVNVGFNAASTNGKYGTKDNKVLEESRMLTVNRNIVEMQFDVNWKIADSEKFLFKLRDPAATVKTVAESAMREVVARNKFGNIIAAGKEDIAQEARQIMQQILDNYESGIEITQLNMRDVQPPEEVVDAFIDVEDAKQDRDKAIEQARAYENDIIPRARGEAEQMIQEAQAYKESIVSKAQGESERFTSIYNKYKVAKDVTRKRMYLETMEEVLKNTNKVLMDNNAGNGVVPYLPLQELKR